MRSSSYYPSSSPLAPPSIASTPRYLSPRQASPRESSSLSAGLQSGSVAYGHGGVSTPRVNDTGSVSAAYVITQFQRPPLASPRDSSSTPRSDNLIVRSGGQPVTSTTTLLPPGTPRMVTRRDEAAAAWNPQAQPYQGPPIQFNNPPRPLLTSSPPTHQQRHRIDLAPPSSRTPVGYPRERSYHLLPVGNHPPPHTAQALADSNGPYQSPRQGVSTLQSPRSAGAAYAAFEPRPGSRDPTAAVSAYGSQPTSDGWRQNSSHLATGASPANSPHLSTPRTVVGVAANHSVASPLADPNYGSPLSARQTGTYHVGGYPATRFAPLHHQSPIYGNQTPMPCFRETPIRSPRETPGKAMNATPRNSRVSKSGAMTAREFQHHSKQSYKGDVTARPSGVYENGQWHQSSGAQTHRSGGRGVLGKFLDSLKTTLGMHSHSPSAETSLASGKEPRVHETVRIKGKPTTTAGGLGSTPELDESVEAAGSESKAPQQFGIAAAPTPVPSVAAPEDRKSFDSAKSSTTGVFPSDAAVQPKTSTKLKESPSEPPRPGTTQSAQEPQVQVRPGVIGDPSSEAFKNGRIAVAESRSKEAKSSISSSVSAPVKPPRLNLAAIVKHAEFPSNLPTVPTDADLPIETPTASEGTQEADDEGKPPSRETPWPPAEPPLPLVAETPAALGTAAPVDAKTPAAIAPGTANRPQSRRLQQPDAQDSLVQKKPAEAASTGSSTVMHLPKIVRFSWIVARALIKLQMQPAETFHLHGVPWSQWELQKIPTLGASPTSCRVQEMYKATIALPSQPSKKLRVFVKSVPVAVWSKQWENQNKWGGEYVTDGENFVMEAAALAFLQQYGNDIAPRLLGFLELSGPVSTRSPRRHGTQMWNDLGSKDNSQAQHEVTHIVIISDLYGEDLLDYLERREREKIPLTDTEKKSLQLDCLNLLHRLHSLGLAHLDFTPENVLYGRQGLRLCDFAKATPILSNNRRHVKPAPHHGSPPFHFESCEPTVGKGAYMPPECWKLYWRLEDTRIQYPLEELWSLASPTDRASYYFRVDMADVYMAGVLLFWLWSDGGIWKCSDTKQDEKYSHLVKSGLNFDLFRECRAWPLKLKELLQAALRPDPKQRSTIEGLINHSWFDKCSSSQARDRWTKVDSLSQSASRQQIQPGQPTVVA